MHTPTPWTCKDPYIIRGPKGIVIAKTTDSKEGYEVNRANEALIVRAINAHQALVGALKAVWESDASDDLSIDIKQSIEKALTLAEGD